MNSFKFYLDEFCIKKVELILKIRDYRRFFVTVTHCRMQQQIEPEKLRT